MSNALLEGFRLTTTAQGSGSHLCSLEAASANKAGPKDALVAQDAVGAVLLRVQERSEAVAHRLSRHHFLPLPADLWRRPHAFGHIPKGKQTLLG
jgi:hypothetical protein